LRYPTSIENKRGGKRKWRLGEKEGERGRRGTESGWNVEYSPSAET
jgi:hypothetical protein